MREGSFVGHIDIDVNMNTSEYAFSTHLIGSHFNLQVSHLLLRMDGERISIEMHGAYDMYMPIR